jgi:hypothetical protein
MRKKGISPEYNYLSVPGSFNMLEKRSFFGSKMMDIEDTIYLDNRDIVYYQQSNGEQVDLNQELSLDSYIYSIRTNKLNNHKLSLDPTQSELDKNNKTKWVVEINLRNILKNYIYAQLKNKRTFANILNSNTIEKNVNMSINRYIDYNIIDRYDYSNIEFFLEYKSLNDNNIKRFETNYDYLIENNSNRFKSIRTIFSNDRSFVRILFTQQEDSKNYTFDYYFNIVFNKK